MEKNKSAKNHHYVPQAYLKNFSNQNNKEYQINVIDKKNNKLYKTNIKNVSCEKNYNRVEELENPNYWEEFYSRQIESKLNKVFKNLIAGAMLTLDGKDVFNEKIKEDFCEIIFSQTYRAKKNRDKLMETGEKVLLETTKKLAKLCQGRISKEKVEYIKKWKPSEDFLKGQTLKLINNKGIYEKIKKGLLEKNWILFRNKNYKTMPFITSDNPVNIYNYRKPKKENGNSLIDENVIIYFSINKMLMLAIFPKKIYGTDMSYINNKLQDLDDDRFMKKLYCMNYNTCLRQVYYK